jgi:hypothetical protein
MIEMSTTAEKLMEQASWTSTSYMNDAVDSIDKKFGKGYAKKNPQLIGAFMQTAALDFLAMYLAQEIRDEIRQHS